MMKRLRRQGLRGWSAQLSVCNGATGTPQEERVLGGVSCPHDSSSMAPSSLLAKSMFNCSESLTDLMPRLKRNA